MVLTTNSFRIKALQIEVMTGDRSLTTSLSEYRQPPTGWWISSLYFIAASGASLKTVNDTYTWDQLKSNRNTNIRNSVLGQHNHTLLLVFMRNKEGRKILYNDTLNTFYLQSYRVRHMIKDQSDSQRGNPLPPLHEPLFFD